MSSGIYSIGITGMNAAQLGLVTAQHNISNASTPGFNRQQMVQASNNPIMTGAGAVGQGTHVQTVSRMYNTFLSNQVDRSLSNVSGLDVYSAEIGQIDNMLADPNSGLSPALQDFFKGVQQVAANPSSLTARQSMLSAAEALTARYQGLESRLTEIANGVNGQIVGAVSSVNSYAQQIANLNERILMAQSSVQQPANDLLDQRDQLVTELNKLVRVTTTQQSNGAFSVFIGSGQQLVVGPQVMTMTAAASSADPERMVLGLKSIGGQVQELPENLITGGQLGGLVQFRAEALDSAFNKLGQVAASMALTFNAQHSLGQDLLGKIAGDTGFVGDLFTLSAPRVVANAYNTSGAVISATLTDPVFNGSNFVTDLTASDYRLDVDSTGANMTLTRLSDGKTWPGNTMLDIQAALDSDPQGFSLNLSGALAASDSFLIQPTREAARNIELNAQIAADPRRLAVAAPMRATGGIANAGTMKIGQGTVIPEPPPAPLPGYTTGNLPLNLTVDAAGNLSPFPASAIAKYSDGTTVTGGVLNQTSGTATLVSVSFDGMSFAISGTASANDTFKIERNNTSSTGVADGRNALALGKLQTQGTVSGGAASFQAAYAQFVSDNGNKTREIQVTAAAQQSLFDQATSSREAFSGVNLDEEAANLIRFQQAYQASAKMLSIGTKLFDTLLAL